MRFHEKGTKKILATLAVGCGLAGCLTLFSSAAAASAIPVDGTGTVIENTTTDSSQREFFTIKAADGNVFYIVVDKTKTGDNVYLLTPVTEETLRSLAESAATANGTAALTANNSTSSASAWGLGTTASQPTVSNAPSTSASNAGSASPQTAGQSSARTAGIALVIGLLVAAVGFYFKVYKKKKDKEKFTQPQPEPTPAAAGPEAEPVDVDADAEEPEESEPARPKAARESTPTAQADENAAQKAEPAAPQDRSSVLRKMEQLSAPNSVTDPDEFSGSPDDPFHENDGDENSPDGK